MIGEMILYRIFYLYFNISCEVLFRRKYMATREQHWNRQARFTVWLSSACILYANALATIFSFFSFCFCFVYSFKQNFDVLYNIKSYSISFIFIGFILVVCFFLLLLLFVDHSTGFVFFPFNIDVQCLAMQF